MNRSVVIGGESHNPTILHPAFLKSQDIIPADWEPAEPPICTPPFARVKFKNDIVFTVTNDRLQIMEERPAADVNASKVPDLATKYIQALPHVPYTGVGINVAGAFECSDPDAFLIERFTKTGPWNERELRLQSVTLLLRYPAPDAALQLTVARGKFRLPDDPSDVTGVIVDANYHADISKTAPVEETERAISRFAERQSHFLTAVETIFGFECQP